MALVPAHSGLRVVDGDDPSLEHDRRTWPKRIAPVQTRRTHGPAQLGGTAAGGPCVFCGSLTPTTAKVVSKSETRRTMTGTRNEVEPAAATNPAAESASAVRSEGSRKRSRALLRSPA